MLSGASLRDWIFCTLTGFGLFVLGSIMPVLALPLMLLYPSPGIYIAYSAGVRAAAASVVCSSLLILLVLPPVFSALYLLMFGLSGLLIGTLARRVEQSGDFLLLAIFISLMFKILVYLVTFRITGLNLLTPDPAMVESAVLAFADSRLSLLSGGDLAHLKENIAQTVNYFIVLVPYGIVAFSAAEVLLSCSLASLLSGKRGGKRFFRLPPLGSWSFPKNILLALVVGVICEMIASANPEYVLMRQLGVNLSAVARTLFIIQGLAVTYCLMERRAFPKFARIAMIIATPIIPLLSDIFSIVGIVDLGFNLRKRLKGE